MSGRDHHPHLTVVVTAHNIPRQARRTLHSLSTAYQVHIAAEDYDVIVVDNGSSPPFDAAILDDLPGNFRLMRIEPGSASPAQAINFGLSEARGELVGVFMDGARLATPGLLHFAHHGVQLYDRAVVASLGWCLGYDLQRWSVAAGYDSEGEDRLLASIGWPRDGYRLFDIAAPDESSIDGWVQPITGSQAMFLSRQTWDALGGVEERFGASGASLLSLDTYRRAMALPRSELVVLTGEATFLQLHRETPADASACVDAPPDWQAQYRAVHGESWIKPEPTCRTYLGTWPRAALVHFARSVVSPLPQDTPPLGSTFDPGVWSLEPATRPYDERLASAVDLARAKFRTGRFAAAAAVARLVRSEAPDEMAAQMLLPHVGPALTTSAGDAKDAAVHLALGEAHHLLGNDAAATVAFEKALTIDNDLSLASVLLSELRMPGVDYYAWLRFFHRRLVPRTYVEIGVESGQSFALARPPTRAIGVDPAPKLSVRLRAESHIFPETSDSFFRHRRLEPLLDGTPLSLGFVDGLHVFEQALRDVCNLAALCGPKSVLLVHDTIPADEVTQARDRKTRFYTGDVWKIVPFLKQHWPELDIFTIATPWSGLTVIAGFPEHRLVPVCLDSDAAVAHFRDMPFAALKSNLEETLNIFANDRKRVIARLRTHGIL